MNPTWATALLAPLLLVGCSGGGEDTNPTSPAAVTETVTVDAEAETIYAAAATETVTETVEVTVTAEPEAEEAPEAPEGAFIDGDIVVEVKDCYMDEWMGASADVAVTNNGSSAKDVSGTVEIVASGTGERLTEAWFYAEKVGPGQTVNEQAVAMSDDLADAFECRVLYVD